MRRLPVGGFLFAAALATRLLFWQATPDRSWPHSAAYKGDALTWLEAAAAMRAHRPFELDLPLRPPGMTYLLAWLWNGDEGGIVFLKLVWCVMGAAAVWLLYRAARRAFGERVASIAASLAAVSTSLLVISTSLNDETPYLLLLIGSLALFEPLRAAPRNAALVAWSALNAVACLVRVEHALVFTALVLLLVAGWIRGRGWRRAAAPILLGAAAFLAPLLPWHLAAWRAIERFNTEPRALPAAERAMLAALELKLVRLLWTQAAADERQRWPAFVRPNVTAFVAATIAERGGETVEDASVLVEAFGYLPRPLAGHPFVCLCGPLDFLLANHSAADGGFNRAPLEEPPPLAGGADHYPVALVRGLPPSPLALVYPPHLQAVNDGYTLGWRWIRAHPGDALRLAGRKLGAFWAGATMGASGYNAPLGLSGVRRPVDLVVTEADVLVDLWRVALLLLAAAGVAAGWRRRELAPWLLLLASKTATTVLFFGYARQGAVVVPAVALLFALALTRLRRAQFVALALVGCCVVAEGVRASTRPQLLVDGRTIATGDPWPLGDERQRRVEVRP